MQCLQVSQHALASALDKAYHDGLRPRGPEVVQKYLNDNISVNDYSAVGDLHGRDIQHLYTRCDTYERIALIAFRLTPD
jgi:hypothetical protein